MLSNDDANMFVETTLLIDVTDETVDKLSTVSITSSLVEDRSVLSVKSGSNSETVAPSWI